MSDLQCPVRVFLVTGPGDRVEDLIEALRRERLARVYSGTEASIRHTAARFADALEVPAVVLPDLAGSAPTDGNGSRLDNGSRLILRQLLGALADEHRGEAILLVGGEPVLAALLPGRDEPLPPHAVVAVEGDADGWRLVRPWPAGG